MIRKSCTIALGMSLALAGTGCTGKKDQVAATGGDAAALCALTPAEFSSWQATGGAPGFVAPDSAATTLNTSCGFFKWGSQMFLWLTSQDATFIHPRGHERGWGEIQRNFYEGTMGAFFTERKLVTIELGYQESFSKGTLQITVPATSTA